MPTNDVGACAPSCAVPWHFIGIKMNIHIYIHLYHYIHTNIHVHTPIFRTCMCLCLLSLYICEFVGVACVSSYVYDSSCSAGLGRNGGSPNQPPLARFTGVDFSTHDISIYIYTSIHVCLWISTPSCEAQACRPRAIRVASLHFPNAISLRCGALSESQSELYFMTRKHPQFHVDSWLSRRVLSKSTKSLAFTDVPIFYYQKKQSHFWHFIVVAFISAVSVLRTIIFLYIYGRGRIPSFRNCTNVKSCNISCDPNIKVVRFVTVRLVRLVALSDSVDSYVFSWGFVLEIIL